MIRVLRWIAVAIAMAAVIDPRIPVPRSERPVVRVVSPESRDVAPIAGALKRAGFVIDPAAPEAARVVVASTAIGNYTPASTHSPVSSGSATRTTIWALDTSPRAPNVRIAGAIAPSVRLPGQALDIRVEVAADGVAGQTTDLVVEQAGIPVAAAQHRWANDETRWQASLRYLPPDVAATTLRVRASGIPGETSAADNAADVAVPAVRGPLRVLVVEAAVTWPAVFVRRALEGEDAIAVSSLQRAAKTVAVRAGDPPSALTRKALEPFEAVVVGAPDDLRAADLDALRWFVETRGGVAIFIPDRPPSGRYVDLAGVADFTLRTLDVPASLGANLHASELLVPGRLPPAATVLAADDDVPVVFSARRGAGAIAFSGALDAWRHRGLPADPGAAATDDAYGRFWRGWLVATAAAVPPALEVSAHPAIVRPGERTAVLVRLRDIPSGDSLTMPPLTGRVVGPDTKIDEPVRLWPTAEPGVYEGEWRARAAGSYNVTVSGPERRGDTTVTVAAGAEHGSSADADSLALVTSASGGQVFPIDEVPRLVDAMERAHPARRIVRRVHPMRSAWWLVPFAGLLCAEWGIRRKRGLP